ALGSRAQQSRAIGAQANRREPASHDQLIPSGNARFQALDHERAHAAVEGKAQAVHPLRARFQIVLVKQSARRLAQQILEYTAEFSQAGLFTAASKSCSPSIMRISSPLEPLTKPPLVTLS